MLAFRGYCLEGTCWWRRHLQIIETSSDVSNIVCLSWRVFLFCICLKNNSKYRSTYEALMCNRCRYFTFFSKTHPIWLASF
jgi:hypothetical protein